MIQMYGIPNCGSVKKARQWLDAHNVEYQFHDVKKDGLSEALLADWMTQVHWSSLLNKQSLTWRKLEDQDKADLNQAKSIPLLCRFPTVMKRPVLVYADGVEVGFQPERYHHILFNTEEAED